MRPWAHVLLVCLAALVCTIGCLPLIYPFLEALSTSLQSAPEVQSSWLLIRNTVYLVCGTLLLALPLGLVSAVLLFRTDLPGRRWFLTGTVLALFVPLPLQMSAWQALLGSDGLFPNWLWGVNFERPWSAGLLPAIWVHGMAGLPWVVLIIGAGLRAVERSLEEEALLAAGPWRVLWSVTLPRCRAAIAAAGLWVALLTAADISVTDMLLVPTIAEEIHTQFTMGGTDALRRTLLVALPGVVGLWVLLVFVMPPLARSMPPLQLEVAPPLRYSLGRFRRPWFLVCLVLLVGISCVPLLGLVWKLGLAGSPRSWSAAHAARQFLGEARLYGGQVFQCVGMALMTGLVTATIALVVCWLSLSSHLVRVLLLAVATLAWALPAPVVGIGLKETIKLLLPIEPVSQLLYFAPSPVPIVWAHTLRFLPFAAAILWPAVRLVPVELRDAARLEGAGPLQELIHVYGSMTRKAFLVATGCVTALALGEVGASARVETPGWESFAKLLFDRMHNGADSNVAALSIVLLAGVVPVVLLTLFTFRVRTGPSGREM